MPRQNLDFNLLVALNALLEECSVTQAAQRLGVTQPAMTHTLNRLRTLFDDPLLVRVKNRMYPTELATSLRVPLEEMMLKADEILHHGESFDPAKCTLEFRMFLEDTGQTVMAATLFSQLSLRAPRARLRLIRHATPDDFQRGNVDLMLWHSHHEHPFLSRLACESRFVTIARKGHPCLEAAPLSLKQFASLPQVTMAGRGTFEVDVDTRIDKVIEEAGLWRNKVVAISSLLAVKRLVGSTDVIATVPEVLLSYYERDIELEVVRTELKLNPVPVYLIWHPRSNSHPAHKWFRDFIVEQYRRFVGEVKAPARRARGGR